MNNTATNFDQAELDKFADLAHRWWGEVSRLRQSGGLPRDASRPARDGWAGAMHQGWFGAPLEGDR